MKYAIVQLQGKQYKVEVGQTLTVDHLAGEAGSTFETSDVLLVRDDKQTQVGTPLVGGAKVTFKILEQGRDEKILVRQYKSKSKYHRRHGHRQTITNLEVTAIA